MSEFASSWPTPRVTPRGAVMLFEPANVAHGHVAAPRLVAAFDESEGHGILALATDEITTSLPASLAFFREIGKRYIARLRTRADLDERWPDIQIEMTAAEVDDLLSMMPPIEGGEYLDASALAGLWDSLAEALRDEVRGSITAYLNRRSPSWNLVGKLCFHLAENPKNAELPFAFVATFAHQLSSSGRAQHIPLGHALKLYSESHDKPALTALLAPIQRAAEAIPFVQGMLDRGDVFHALAWTPREAFAFLQASAAMEQHGLVVRVPDWWTRHSRPKVGISLGDQRPAGIGAAAILDFSAGVTIDGEKLSRAEIQQILSSTDGLTLLRGKWVEVDPAKLQQALDHWKAVEKRVKREGISFLDGMRMLAGVSSSSPVTSEVDDEWVEVHAGRWLDETLHALRDPKKLADIDPGTSLKTKLRPYQKEGTRWMHLVSSLGLGACLADDMGLGKTIEVLALLLILAKQNAHETHLLVVPASLIGNWQSEIARFAPSLRPHVIHASAKVSDNSRGARASTRVKPANGLSALDDKQLAKIDLVITTYGMLLRAPWIAQRSWGLVLLDEAQAIKNPDTKQTRAVKMLRGRSRIALTGTPVENHLSDLWSLFDFLAPGLLGSERRFAELSRKLEERGSYAPLRALVRPYVLRRLKTDRRIIQDLPEKTEVVAFCGLSRKQVALYENIVSELEKTLATATGIERRGAVLASLMRLKQVCNHPSQVLRDEGFARTDSGKMMRVAELCDEIVQRQERALVFTQFREMTGPLASFLAEIFGAPGLVLHGGTPVAKRRAMVEQFQKDDGPPFFVISLKAGGVGLNLTGASHVIHFDRWWNPAVENQATDRAFRIGQKRNVLVHKLVCKGTIEERIHALIVEKQKLSDELLEGSGEAILTELDNEALLDLVRLDVNSALEES